MTHNVLDTIHLVNLLHHASVFFCGTYSTRPRLWNGYYEKRVYLVHVSNDEAVRCWPNAGIMNAMDGSGRAWVPGDNVLVSPHVGLVWDERRVPCAGALSITPEKPVHP